MCPESIKLRRTIDRIQICQELKRLNKESAIVGAASDSAVLIKSDLDLINLDDVAYHKRYRLNCH